MKEWPRYMQLKGVLAKAVKGIDAQSEKMRLEPGIGLMHKKGCKTGLLMPVCMPDILLSL
jgi:hypothetical protein